MIMLTHVIVATLWHVISPNVMAMPAPDGPTNDPASKLLLQRQCQNLQAINAPAVDFGGTQYISSGHPDVAVSGYTPHDPTTYQYEIYQLVDILFKSDAERLIQGFNDSIPEATYDTLVPQPFDFKLPGLRISFKVTTTGDMNVIFLNLRGCIDAFAAFYAKRTEVIVPFTQCAIHLDNYLEGKIDMIASRITAEECASIATVKF